MYSINDIQKGVMAAVAKYNNAALPENRIVRIDLFGSYAQGNQTESSDVDFLVEFASPTAGLFALAQALGALEEQFSCQVDMVAAPLPEDTLLTIDRTVPLYAAA